MSQGRSSSTLHNLGHAHAYKLEKRITFVPAIKQDSRTLEPGVEFVLLNKVGAISDQHAKNADPIAIRKQVEMTPQPSSHPRARDPVSRGKRELFKEKDIQLKWTKVRAKVSLCLTAGTDGR